MNPTDDTSLQPMEFVNFCIRDYVAEIRRKDWKKCCPFNLSGDSAESYHQEKMVFASLLPDGIDSLGDTPENAKALKLLTSSVACNPEALNFSSEIVTGVIAGNDTTTTINEIPLDSAYSKATYAHCQIEKIFNEEIVASENNIPKDVVIDYELIKNISDGASKSSSNKVKDDVQFQNENNISEDTIAVENEKYTVFDHDGEFTISDEERNLEGRKPKKFRLLSDILKELAGPCDTLTAEFDDTELTSEELTSESEDDDDFTLDTLVRKKKGVRITSKSGSKSNNKMRTCKVIEPSFVRAKRLRAISQIFCGKDTEIGFKRHLRNTRIARADMQMTNKRKKYSAEIIVHETNISPSSLGGGENTSTTQKDSLIEPSFDQDKRMNDVSQVSCDKDQELCSRRHLRKTRTARVNMKMKNKRKKSSPEIIVLETQIDPSSLGGGENTSVTQKDSLAKPSFDRDKRMKEVTQVSCGKDPDFGCKRYLRKPRTPRVDIGMINKPNNSSAPIIMPENKVAPSSLGGRENASITQKYSLLSRGDKNNVENIQEDSARVVLKLLDESQRHLTKENSSRSANGKKISPLVQPTIAILNNKDIASGCVEKRIRESSPPIDNESMAASQLLRIFNARVNTKVSSKTSNEDPTSSVSKGIISCGLDEIVQPASRSVVCQPHVQVTMINDPGLLKIEKTKSETSICSMSLIPYEFSTINARNFMITY